MDSRFRGNDIKGNGNDIRECGNDKKNNRGLCYTPLLEKEEILKYHFKIV